MVDPRQLLLDSLTMPAFVVGTDYRYVATNEANKAAIRAMYGADVVLGSDCLGSVSIPAERERMRSCIDKALAGDANSEGSWFGDGGDSRFYQMVYTPVWDGGSIVGVTVVANDMTELTIANERLQRLGSIVESSDDAILSWDLSGVIASWNRGAHRLYGYSADEMIGRHVAMLVPPVEEGRFPLMLKRIERGERVERFPTKGVCKDGSLVDVSLTVSPILDESGRAIAASVVARDITSRVRMEAELSRDKEFSNTLLETLADGVLACDADGVLRLVNRAARDWQGIDSLEKVSVEWAAHHGLREPDGVTALSADRIPLLSAIAGDRPVEQQISIVRPGRPLRHVLCSGDSFCDVRGNRLGAVVVMHDITHRIRAEEALRLSETKFATAFHTSPDAVNINRVSDGMYIDINEGFTQIIGYERDEVIGRTSLELCIWADPDDRLRLVEMFSTVGQVDNLEAFFRRKDGGLVPGLMSGRLITIEGEQCALTVTRDMSSLRASQEALKASYASLERMTYGVVQAMGRVVETRDPYTSGHEERTAKLSRMIAEQMGLPKDDVDAIEMGALLHDVGKLGVPAELLTKPGRLSPQEFDIIKEHCQHSYDILKDIAFPWPLADFVLQHHERMDGSGYPSGLSGDEILVPARVLAVADVVEAMASDRPYRAALGLEEAMAEIDGGSGRYDPDVVRACLRVYEAGRITV